MRAETSGSCSERKPGGESPSKPFGKRKQSLPSSPISCAESSNSNHTAQTNKIMPTSNQEQSTNLGVSSTAPTNIEDEQVGEADPNQEETIALSMGQKRSRTSSVWDDFTEIVVDGKTTSVKCKHCFKPYQYSKGGLTSSFKRHIGKCVIRKAKLSGKGNGPTQSILSIDSYGDSGSLGTYKYDKEAIKDITTKMIMVHEYPFKIVEHKLFRIHNKMLNPKYESFGRQPIRDHAMKIYAEEKQKLKVMFTGVSRVSLTSDLWTSNQTKGYMCITGHFCDLEWKLQNRILNFCLLPPPHTGIAIADKIFECLSEWGLESKISTITFDNASSNDAAIRILKEQFQGRDALYFGGKIFHVRCFAHILNLMVQDGLSPLKTILENVRESVKFITSTPSRLHKFNEVVKNMSLPTHMSLILDCVTRWNSTFHMLDRAIIFKDAFPKYAERDATYCWLSSDTDWNIARDVCKFLAIFDEVTDIFSGHEYATANLFFPEVWKIRKILDDMANDQRPFMLLMVTRMKEKFDKYWKECNLFMIIAAVLDPRNKMMLITYVFAKLYEEGERERKIDSIREELHNLYEDYVARGATGESGDNGQGGGRSLNENENENDTYRTEFEMWVRATGSVQPNRKEIDIYLEENILMGGGKDFDVLAWWKSNTLKFPTLSKMARDILSIHVTTVPSESTFSAGRRVISDDRASLGDDTIEGLLCAENWLRVEFKIK